VTDGPALRIVSVSTADVLGGAERVARELHESYLAAGEDAWLAVGSRRGADARTVAFPNRERRSGWARAWMAAADALPQRGASFHVARAMRRVVAEPLRWARRESGREDFDFPGTAAVARAGGQPADVLHLHNLHGEYFDLRALPQLSASMPTVVSLHDAWLLSGHCAHSFACERWETGCGHCPALWIHPAVPRDATAFNWRRKRDIFARSRLHVAAPCAWLADRVRCSMLMPAARSLRVIPFGVNLDVFRPADKRATRAALGLDPSRPLVLVFANSLRDRGWKDSEAFRGALERLRGDAAAAQWVAIGDARADVTVGAVRLRGVPAEHDDARLARWYQAADCYVHPARADTFPLTVLESLACGTPVVATAVGGIPEQLDSFTPVAGVANAAAEPTGALVPAGDGAALAAALEQFFGLDDASRARLADNAARAAARRFDRRAHQRDYLAWIHQLAAERTGA
jgi:glycosyltransferase involved in cell wall biosynthesis